MSLICAHVCMHAHIHLDAELLGHLGVMTGSLPWEWWWILGICGWLTHGSIDNFFQLTSLAKWKEQSWSFHFSPNRLRNSPVSLYNHSSQSLPLSISWWTTESPWLGQLGKPCFPSIPSLLPWLRPSSSAASNSLPCYSHNIPLPPPSLPQHPSKAYIFPLTPWESNRRI